MRYYLAVAAALALQASAAHADSIVALTGDDIIASVDTRAAKTTGLAKIDGIGPVLGLDVRPADGQLYALASDDTVAIVDPATGKTTVKSKLDMPPPAGVRITVDFNPVADRMRIIGEDGTNLRANVDDGKVTKDQNLKFADGTVVGQVPAIIAGAYSNSVKGTKETTLYDIDGTLSALFRQAPPNDGILNLIGETGIDAETVGFDIVSDGAGGNTGMLVAKGNIYTLDIATGKVGGGKKVAGLPGGVRDIAVLPTPMMKQAAAPMMNAPVANTPVMNNVMTVMPQTQQTSVTVPNAVGAMQPQPMQQKAAVMGGQQNGTAPKMMKRGPQCNK